MRQINKNKANQNCFVIKIHIPKKLNVKELSIESSTDKESILNLINNFFFDGTKEGEDFDANFISEYDEKTDSFKYYIQRLLGFEIDEDNKTLSPQWNLYINHKKIDFTNAVNNNLMISKKDYLELKFENNCEIKNGNNDLLIINKNKIKK